MMTQNKARRNYTWLLLVPAGIWYLVFFLIPSLFPLIFSFAQSDPTGGIFLRDFSVDNYARFLDCNFAAWGQLGECIYLKVFWQTIVFALLGTLGCLVLAYPLAYFLATRVGKWRTTLLVLIIIPFWTSFLIRTYAWVVLLADQGLINSFLVDLGILADDARIPMLYNPFAVYLGIIYNYLPLMIFPLYVSLERLDKTLLEASKDLGANRLATFRNITLPLTAPGLFTGILLTFIPLTGEYIIPAILGGSKTLLMGNLVANQFLQARDWAFGSASSVMLIGILVVFILIWYRFSEGQSV
ncbi:MAG TPA: ABC transporter permease, partial [Anaerolineae bacterium]|nr:ABC transporter permease [Anaerolineae bacterium]